jgi:glutathione synthase/RimK-type ligase-like ATP-grasp enzyme
MIIILSSVEDIHASTVAKILADKGAEHRIINLSEFPMRMDIGLSFADGGPSQFALRLSDGLRLDFKQVSSVWWRRPQPFVFPPTLTDPAHRAFAQQECDFAFRGMYAASNALWINDVVRDAKASHKPWQLEVAREIGLSIPKTLITNSTEDVRRFRANAEGPVIYKAFLASPMAWRETRILRDEDMALIDQVRLAPVIFQNYVEAVADLRVTVIGKRVFAASTETAKTEYATDVRMNPDIKWQPYTLPDSVQKGLLKLMDIMGLEYGAADFRVTPDGRHIFLEINPAGQFLFIQNATGMPIAEAMADRLIAGRAG